MPGNFPGQLPPGMDPNSLPDISKLKFPKK
jgi:hypothetical protein